MGFGNLDIKKRLAGKFIVLDGPDGAGKGTQMALLRDALTAAGLEVVCTREPGGTAIGERIRELLLGHTLNDMDVRCEVLLFMASRAQLVAEVIGPAIRAGKTVLCDRFISATCAYQGAAGYDVKQIIELGHMAVGRTWPDLTLVLDVPAEVGFVRIGRDARSAELDAMESRPIEFHRKVRELFRELPAIYPRLVKVIDASGAESAVHERIMEVLTLVDF